MMLDPGTVDNVAGFLAPHAGAGSRIFFKVKNGETTSPAPRPRSHTPSPTLLQGK